jgi:hypothetical protein
MPWSSFIRAMGAKRSLREVPAYRGGGGAGEESAGAHRTMMGIDVSPVHGRHCICSRCAMLTERIRIRDAA